MGGFDSGRHEYATTPTVGECTSVRSGNVSEFTQQPGLEGKIWYGDKDDPDMQMFVASEGESDIAEGRAARLRLVYHTEDAHTGDVIDKYDYSVSLDYTECHFGGYRPWFRCPDCSERVGKLYMPPGGYRFSCRECLELGYHTSRTSGDDIKQAELRYKRAFQKADKDARRPHPNNLPHLPDRPKGMHHDTFERLVSDVRAARDEWDKAFREKEKKMLRQMSG
jgi:hypothetical protein